MTPKGRKRIRIQRKRLGQFFTPDWIVDYLIRHTLSPALSEDPVRLLGEFTVLDPACGDGAFLTGVLRFLAEKVKSYPMDKQHLFLRSIVDSIHGIDVDPKALAQCQRHLEQVSNKLLGVPADFSQRILLGNSLIQTDQHAQDVFGDALPKKFPVDWHRVYPWVMREGGFDAIIGNPPFLSIKSIEPELKTYIRHRYRTVHQQFDILIPFIELGLDLLRPGGRLGYVISNKVLAADYGSVLRKTLVKNYVIEQMVDLSHLNAFEDAAAYPHLIVIRKPRIPDEVHQNRVQLPRPPSQPNDISKTNMAARSVPQHYYNTLPNTILAPSLTEEKFSILRKLLHNTIPLGQATTIRCGIAKTGFTKHLLSVSAYDKLSKASQAKTLPFLNAGDVQRYKLRCKKYLTFTPTMSSQDQWQDFKEPKLVIAGMAKRLRVALDETGHALGRVYYITHTRTSYNPRFLLGLLNSRLINAFFSLLFVATHLRSGYIRYNATYLEQIPIVTPTPHQEEKLAGLAKLAAQNPISLQKGLDHEINDMVNKLYGLTGDDVKLLEE
ncbi:MAG: Eco57I restriction-modification methylase domain-containing protein [Promethearchaeota archaeon]